MFFFRRRARAAAARETPSQGQGYNVIREEENRRYLRELLSRKRPEQIQKRLLQVLGHEKETLKKIRLVENVDTRGVEALLGYERRIGLLEAAGARKDKPGPLYRFELPAGPDTASGESVFSPGRGGVFRYFFSDYRKISEFGRFHLLLKGRLTRGRHELTDDFLRFWNVELKVMLSFLQEPLAAFLKDGWQEATPLQYNLVARFARLGESYQQERLLVLERRVSRMLCQRTEALARLWFVLLQKREYPELLLDALQHFLQNRKEFQPVQRKILMAADSVLQERKNGPCLKNALHAVYMAGNRHFLTWSAYRALHGQSTVPHDVWDAAPDVQDRIGKFLQSRRDEVEEIRRNLFFLSEMNITALEQMEEPVLNRLYDLQAGTRHARGEAGRTPASSCRELLKYDMVSLFEKAAGNFLHHASPLLQPQSGMSATPAGLYPGEELELLGLKLEAIRTLRITHERMTIPVTFYRQYFGRREALGSYSETEQTYCLHLREIGAAAYRLAVKVNHLLSRLRSPVETGQFRLEIPAAASWFAGMGPEEVLEEIMGTALGFALVLEEPTLLTLVRRRQVMEERLEELLRVLRRMGAAE